MEGEIYLVKDNEVEVETPIGKVVGGWLFGSYPLSSSWHQ